MVTNIAMFVPLTFCALDAWSHDGRRSGRWWMAAAIVVGGVGLSFALEFSQVFVSERTTSIHDVIAQTIGSLLGLATWLIFGAPLTRWVRGLLDERDQPALCVKLLYAYAALFIFYSLLPLNPTISIGQIWRKYKSGMINFLPFLGPGEFNILALVMKTVLYVPIGYLLACLAGRGRRPLFAALTGGALFSLGVESLQVGVHSRIATVTDVILGAAGAATGGLLAGLVGPIATGQGVHGAWWQRWGFWLKLPATVSWLALMVYQRWDTVSINKVSHIRKQIRSPI